MEKTLKIKAEGVTPLIMHNSQSANPMNEYSRLKKPIIAKRANKTEADHEKLAELDFLSSLYWSKELNGLYMPTENVQKMLLEAARALDQRKAKKQIVGIRFDEHLGWPLISPNRSDLDKLIADQTNKYFKIVTLQRTKTPSTKAIFNQWSFECTMLVDTDIVSLEDVKSWWEYAGSRVGLGGRRPYGPTPGQFGRFVVSITE